MEQSDIVPLLTEMNFQVDPEDSSHSTLVILNPPVISFDNLEAPFIVEEVEEKGD